MIRKKGDQWCLYTHDGTKVLGCHDTKAGAEEQERAVNISKHALRVVALKAQSFDVRTETFMGREWTVVPVVALVEGVLRPMGSEGPEFVPEEVYAKAPAGWNGRPVFIGHPVDEDGNPIIGNSPETLEKAQVGMVFNAVVDDHKLKMEAWLDNERASDVPELKDMLARIAEKAEVEISVGALVIALKAAGIYQDAEYEYQWLDLTQDHLALLPEGDIGACSREKGCGIRAAKETTTMKDKKQPGLLGRLLGMLRAAQSPEEMSDNDLRRKLMDALREEGGMGTGYCYVEAIYPDLDQFVYCVSGPNYDSPMEYYRRGYSVSETGKVTLGDTPEAVEPLMIYEPVALKGQPAPRAAAEGCRCHETNEQPTTLKKETKMTKDELKAQIDAMTDEQAAAVTIGAPAAAAVTETPAAEPETLRAAAQAPTFDSLLAAATPEVRESIQAGIRAAAEKKAASIKLLKDSGRNTFTDEQLKAMSQEQLDAMVKLADVKAATDHTVAPVPASRAAAETETVPAAPDMGAALKAAREKK